MKDIDQFMGISALVLAVTVLILLPFMIRKEKRRLKESRNRYGNLLLKCDLRWHTPMAIFSIVFLICLILYIGRSCVLLLTHEAGFSWQYMGQILINFVMTLVALNISYMQSFRLEFRQKGLIYFGSLPWNEIESCNWIGSNNNVLQLTPKRGTETYASTSVPPKFRISKKQQAQVEQVMNQVMDEVNG